MTKLIHKSFIFVRILTTSVLLLPATLNAAPTVITLTQVPCQFLENESKDYQFTSTQQSDCEEINNKTSEDRLAKSKTITLNAGEYTFRVTNKNVPYSLGFYLRPANLIDRIRLPNVSGGGLETGSTKDYEITLIKGEYIFSCPLNPTPDYKLVVTE